MYQLSEDEHDALQRALQASTTLISKGKLLQENTTMYTAYLLSAESRELLLERFPPKYEKVFAHHITEKFGVPKDAKLPPKVDIKVIGIADSEDGLEALVVSVNGSPKKETGGYYHITWSLDPEKYAPKDSNDLVKYGSYKLTFSIPITTSRSVEA